MLSGAASIPQRPVNITKQKLADVVDEVTDGWGADVVFEASGSPHAYDDLFRLPRPGGVVVLVGLPVDPVPFDVSLASVREIRIESVFRYAHQYPRAIAMFASGKVDLKPLIAETYPFSESVAAFDRFDLSARQCGCAAERRSADDR